MNRYAFALLAVPVLCIELLSSMMSSGAAEVSFVSGSGVSIGPLVVAKPASRDSLSLSYEVITERVNRSVLESVRRAHMKIVRLVTTPLPLMQTDADARSKAIDQVITTVNQIQSYDLSVVVDLHFWSPSLGTAKSVITDPVQRQSLMAGIRALSQRLQSMRSVALELLNEPPVCDSTTPVDWRFIQKSLVSKVREVAPSLPLVLTGCGGQLDGILALDPKEYVGDQSILFTFHFYEPFIFTHQQTYFGAILRSIPYPGGGDAESRMSIEDMVPLDMRLVQPRAASDVAHYLRTTYDDATIAARFDQVRAWADRNRIDPRRIILGEFGTTLKVGPDSAAIRDDQVHWLRTVRTNAERIGVSWVFWAYPSPGNVDYDPATGFFQPDTLAALGLTAPAGTTP